MLITKRYISFNLYLQSGSKINYATTRKAQLEILKTKMPDSQYTKTLVMGDFNMIMDNIDTTGNFNNVNTDRNAWKTIEKSVPLTDIYRKIHKNKLEYTRITQISSSRIDRIYGNQNITCKITEYKHVRNFFSDHNNCPFIKLNIELNKRWRPSFYKINNANLKYLDIQENIIIAWENWKLQKRHIKNSLKWWELGKIIITNEIKDFSQIVKKLEKQRYEENVEKLNDITNQPNHGKEKANLENNINIYENKINTGALIRSKIIEINNEETPSRAFFSL